MSTCNNNSVTHTYTWSGLPWPFLNSWMSACNNNSVTCGLKTGFSNSPNWCILLCFLWVSKRLNLMGFKSLEWALLDNVHIEYISQNLQQVHTFCFDKLTDFVTISGKKLKIGLSSMWVFWWIFYSTSAYLAMQVWCLSHDKHACLSVCVSVSPSVWVSARLSVCLSHWDPTNRTLIRSIGFRQHRKWKMLHFLFAIVILITQKSTFGVFFNFCYYYYYYYYYYSHCWQTVVGPV